MIVRIRQSGGFAGLAGLLLGTIDTGRLDPNRAAQVRAHVAELAEAAAEGEAEVGADMSRYDVEVQDGGLVSSYTFLESDPGSLPRPLQQLMTVLR